MQDLLCTMLAGEMWVPNCRRLNVLRKKTPQLGFFEELALLGETGVWYDPNDLSTLFQDSAGTIPVTAEDQPVGLMKNKFADRYHASQSNNALRPVLKYDSVREKYHLLFNDDENGSFLVTNTINFNNARSVTSFCAVNTLSDASAGYLFETGPSSSNGTISINMGGANGAENIASGSKGTIASYAVLSKATRPEFNAPFAAALVLRASIQDKENILRINGVEAIRNNSDQGTGNYLNNRLYIGKRYNIAYAYSGCVYSMVILSRAVSEDELSRGETEIMQILNV